MWPVGVKTVEREGEVERKDVAGRPPRVGI
jgi:hypothetical protein